MFMDSNISLTAKAVATIVPLLAKAQEFPNYVSHDNANRIMQTLKQSVGEGGFNYLTGMR